jgi:Na+/H+-dicarboxylate symporter
MPIGVFFVMANQFLAINLQALITLGILTLVISGCILFQVIVYILIIWLKSNSNLSYFFKSFLETFILTFTTRSSIITLPKAMEAMIKLNYSKTLIDLYLPFGISLFRIGTMSFFAIVTLFVMGIFDIEITFTKCLFIVFACIFAAISTTGISGIIGLQMISIIFTPLGLPIGGVLAILIVVDAIVDIFETFANIMGNCAIVALVDKKSQSNNINSNF